jgi:hypothetical protein
VEENDSIFNTSSRFDQKQVRCRVVSPIIDQLMVDQATPLPSLRGFFLHTFKMLATFIPQKSLVMGVGCKNWNKKRSSKPCLYFVMGFLRVHCQEFGMLVNRVHKSCTLEDIYSQVGYFFWPLTLWRHISLGFKTKYNFVNGYRNARWGSV